MITGKRVKVPVCSSKYLQTVMYKEVLLVRPSKMVGEGSVFQCWRRPLKQRSDLTDNDLHLECGGCHHVGGTESGRVKKSTQTRYTNLSYKTGSN